MRLFSTLCGLFVALSALHLLSAAEDSGIVLPAGTWECHGTAKLRGQTAPERFWLRLLPTDPAYGHNRIVEVVYTPPVAAVLGGTHLSDTPFWLLDPRTRLMAWNDRGTSSQMQPAAGAYQVTRERTPSDHTDIVLDEKKISANRGWDRTATPLLLALAWRADTTMTVPCIDLFGDEPETTVSWHGSQVMFAGDAWKIIPDEHGRLAKLQDAQGADVVTVAEWLAVGAPAVIPALLKEKPAGAK